MPRTFLLLALSPFCFSAVVDLQPKVDPIFVAYTRPGTPGCAVGILQDGQTVLSKGYGLADLEQQIPISGRTRFYMASVSKQFTSMALLLAEKEGLLKLDDPIRKYVPELPAYADEIPIRRMLDHTAGLRDYLALWGMRGFSNESVLRADPTLDLIARQTALNYPVGSEYSYSNSGYFLAAAALERASGKTLAAYAAEKIYRPLKMASSRFQQDHGDPVTQRAHGYEFRGGTWKISDIGFDIVGSGGMYSNIEDMLKWARNFEQPVVGGDLLQKLQSPGTLTDGRTTPGGYALGIIAKDGTLSHSGGATGYRTYFLRIPSHKTTVITLCNAGNANSARLAEQVAEAVTSYRFPKTPAPQTTPKLRPVEPGEMELLAGTYWSDELESTWRLQVRDGRWMVRTEGATYAVSGCDPDGLFHAGSFHFGPVRDGSGRITGLNAGAGRARNITFRRK